MLLGHSVLKEIVGHTFIGDLKQQPKWLLGDLFVTRV